MIVLMDPMEDHDDILRANRSRERQFVFDMVFDAKSTQQDVFEKTTKCLLNGVLNGYNATVFAYGATGAGKTYTMLGTEEEPGIMFRTLHDLFIEISKTSNDLMYQVSMSYLEIYNELIRDLLSPSNGFLELREDAKGGVQVTGISELVAETPQEVMYMLHKGNKERTQEPTKANKTSSRSHAVLQVNIKQRNKVRMHSQEVRLGKLYMIDLAGSERAAQTQNTGKRMVEGAHINRSLLALGNCINALSEKGNTKYVNYRDSKLTRILKDSLGGNSKTVMIAHVSPASIHFEESRNTLVYADRAKYIRTKLRRNVIDVSFHISQYQQIIQELAQEIATLKDQRQDLESRISHSLDPRLNTYMNGEDKSKLEETLKLRESLLQSFKHQITLRKTILELENSIMDLTIEVDRHTKLIDQWEAYKENGETQLKSKFTNKAEQTADSVNNSREELKVVEQERDELEIKRKDAVKELDSLKVKSKKLRDLATKKLNTAEQKEILGLLLKNFEFEIRNIEIQADIFKRDFKLREQDMVILRLEQHRSLCDTLIFQQRRLITDNNILIPHDLKELYQLYSRDVNDGQLMKDLTISSTSNSSLATISPKPSITNAFLTQIKEENADHSIKKIQNGSNINIKSFINQSDYNEPKTSPWSNKDDYKVFTKSNNNKMNPINPNKLNKKQLQKEQQQKEQNYQNPNYISSNGAGGLVSNLIGPQAYFSTKDKNNVSMLSSSTTDSNAMEVIFENNSTANNKNLISTRKNSILNANNSLLNIVPPGQVISNSTKTNSFEQMNAAAKLQADKSNSLELTDSNAKRLTQGIAAIAAQRKAYQHHRELMQELGHHEAKVLLRLKSPNNSNSKQADDTGIASPSRKINDQLDDLFEKKNSILTDGRDKAKKQVKIREIVQYKLPDDEDNFTVINQ